MEKIHFVWDFLSCEFGYDESEDDYWYDVYLNYINNYK